jgi:hypothetical protein
VADRSTFNGCTSIKVPDSECNRLWLGKMNAALGARGTRYPARYDSQSASELADWRGRLAANDRKRDRDRRRPERPGVGHDPAQVAKQICLTAAYPDPQTRPA